jgi:hypothetical protein
LASVWSEVFETWNVLRLTSIDATPFRIRAVIHPGGLMRIEPVEIYSDAFNGAVIRHRGRRFPGTLIQGDTLFSLCFKADEICASGLVATPVIELP